MFTFDSASQEVESRDTAEIWARFSGVGFRLQPVFVTGLVFHHVDVVTVAVAVVDPLNGKGIADAVVDEDDVNFHRLIFRRRDFVAVHR